LQFEGKAKDTVDIVKEIKYTHYLVRKSFGSAEKMRVVLLESADASKAGEGT